MNRQGFWRFYCLFQKKVKYDHLCDQFETLQGGLLKRKWGNTDNRKCGKFEMDKIRPEGSGGNREQSVNSPQNCDNSSRRLVFFKIIFINAYLSVIFASIFSVMIKSFLLSAADIFHMCQTRYLNSSLFIQFFLPAFTVVKVLRAM